MRRVGGAPRAQVCPRVHHGVGVLASPQGPPALTRALRQVLLRDLAAELPLRWAVPGRNRQILGDFRGVVGVGISPQNPRGQTPAWAPALSEGVLMVSGEAMTERNKDLVRRFVEQLINQGDPAAVDALIAEDYVDHDAPPQQVPGPDGVKETLAMIQGSLLGLRATIEDMIAEDDKVVTRHRAEATHVGPFLGRPATGKRLHWQAISIYRIAGGKLAERWGLIDIRALQWQLDN